MPKLAVVRLFAAGLLLFAATSAIFAAKLPSLAAASPNVDGEAGWSQATLIDPLQGDPTSISCPTPSFCAAVDRNGNVLTYDGKSWSKPDSIDAYGFNLYGNDSYGGYLDSVSCPTPSFCVAVDTNRNFLTYNGSSWSSPHEVNASGGSLLSVSCPTPSFCVAVDLIGDVLTYNGSSWSSPDHIDGGLELESVSCPTSSFCAAVDNSGNVLTYDNGSWSSRDSIDLDNGETNGMGLESVSCPTPNFCAAVDYNGNVLTYDGRSWSSPESIDPSGGGLISVSCPTTSFCAAVDLSGNVLTYGGGSWSSPHNIDARNEPISVACPTTRFCGAVDRSGNVLTYDGSSWSSPASIDAGNGYGLESVSCPTTSFCAAVDDNGNVLTYDGGSWSSPDSIDAGRGLVSVSCPTASFCAAVDDNGNVLTYDGGSWSSPDEIDAGRGLVSVSCPTASFCAAVDDNGNVLTYDGGSWSSPDEIEHPYGGYLVSVSCPTARFCAAVDKSGNVFIYDGSSWSSPDSIDAGQVLISVSCPTTRFCAAVATIGNVFTYDNSSWSSPDKIDASGGALSSVSCPTASFCAAVDTIGNVFTYNGSSWSSPDIIDPAVNGQSSVSCPTANFCAAVDVSEAITYLAQASLPACADVIFLGARGSGDPPQRGQKNAPFKSEGPAVYSISSEIGAEIQTDDRTFASYPVVYPADPVSQLKPSLAELKDLLPWSWNKIRVEYYKHHMAEYFASIAAGARATVLETEHWAQICSRSQIVLAGYSQGAMAIHQAELQLASGHRAVLHHVAATLLLGDGDRVSYSQAVRFGTSPARGQGIRASGEQLGLVHGLRTDVPVPRSTAEICNAEDIVCDFDWAGYLNPIEGASAVPQALDNIVDAIKVHTSYVRHTVSKVTWTDPALVQAASWAAHLVDSNAAVVTTAHLPSGTIGRLYSVTVAAHGGKTPYTWAVSTGQLPQGLTLSRSGVISGTPSKAGAFSFKLRVVTAGSEQSTRSFSIVIQAET